MSFSSLERVRLNIQNYFVAYLAISMYNSVCRAVTIENHACTILIFEEEKLIFPILLLFTRPSGTYTGADVAHPQVSMWAFPHDIHNQCYLWVTENIQENPE